MSRYDITLKYTYKGMPDKVKKYLKDLLGKDEYRMLMHTIRCRQWVMLIGPECSGKSTIREILLRLGYPYVIDDNGVGKIVKTTKVIELGHHFCISELLEND